MSPGEDGGEGWNHNYSNVVCVRTKSSKESENSEEVPVVNIQPTVLRCAYGGGSLAIPPSQPVERRRIIRLSYNPPLTIHSVSPTRYEGSSKILIGPKSPATNSVISDLDFSHLPLSRPRRSTAVVTSPEPRSFVDLPEVTSLPRTSVRDYFRPLRVLPIVRWSISPLTWSTRYSTRPALLIPTYWTGLTSGATGSRTIYTGSVTPPPSRGILDVSYLFKSPYSHKGIDLYSGASSAPVPSARSTYRSDPWPALGAYRPPWRSSTEWRTAAEFGPAPLSTYEGDIFSTLRYRTERARGMLNTHRSLIAKYLPESGFQISSIDSASHRDKNFGHSYYSHLPSILSFSRVIPTENRDFTSGFRSMPWVPDMSETRRRIRNIIYKASSDHGYRV